MDGALKDTNQMFTYNRKKQTKREPLSSLERILQMATKYENHDEFCRAKHLLTTGNCHMKIDCAECKEIWNAAKR